MRQDAIIRMQEARKWWAYRLIVGGAILVSVSTVALAKHKVSRVAKVRHWHRQYLHRDPNQDKRNVSAWCYWFRLGHSETDVLAAILSTDEYYRKAGSNRRGLIAAMFRDGAPNDDTEKNRRAFYEATRNCGRERLGREFIERYTEALKGTATD